MSGDPQSIVQSADVRQVKTWLDRNEILLVDVRETSEYEVEHIAGALLLPLSSFDPEIFPELPNKKVVLHCAIGKRSEAAGRQLLKQGHGCVIHMTGGIEAWKAAGYATEVQILPPEPDAPQPAFLCPHPGRVLQEEYLAPLRITARDLSEATGLTPFRIAEVLDGTSPVDVEMSLRLARYFSTAGDFWVRLQLDHDMERAKHMFGAQLRTEITPRTAGL